MSFLVHITRPVPEVALEILQAAGCRVTMPTEPGLPDPSELREAVREADGLLSILTEPVTMELLEAAPRLKVVSNMAVGFDNIDVVAATARGIAVCNTPGVLTETTADFTWALLMAVARRLVEGDAMVRAGEFHWWGPKLLMGSDIHGKILGVVGFGKIGQAVARRARGFAMEVLYCGETAPHRSPLGRKVSFEELLERADFVSLHVPYRPSTHHLITGNELRRMKRSAFLINTARGAVVKEDDLVTALTAGEIAGAALDVFEREPEVHPNLLSLDQVVLAPHAASASLETRSLMARMAAENLLACLTGDRPHSIVNPEVLS